jgi:hypothetical protein
MFVLRAFAIRAVLEERIKLVNKGITGLENAKKNSQRFKKQQNIWYKINTKPNI